MPDHVGFSLVFMLHTCRSGGKKGSAYLGEGFNRLQQLQKPSRLKIKLEDSLLGQTPSCLLLHLHVLGGVFLYPHVFTRLG